MTAHILCWRDPSTHEVHYIPTDPEARKWRGPFANHEAMLRKVITELGTDDVAAVWTRIPPHHLRGAKSI